MSSYAFWNNKGGVGKSFLCFVAASEYAHRYPKNDVYVIDLCPQANVSEILLGGNPSGPRELKKNLKKKPRCSVAGYLESRLNSPFQMVRDVSPFVCRPHDFNKKIPENLLLICGDNLIELFAEPIRQTSQLEIPFDAWKQVLNWIKDLIVELRQMSGDREAVFTIDCNPSYAIYTQLAIVAADYLIVPFTADDSSRRAFENLIALVFGIADRKILPYAKISFAKRAKKEGVSIPKLHTFINNRVTIYEGKPSKAFMAVSKTIKTTIDDIYKTNRSIFSNHSYHVASVRMVGKEGGFDHPLISYYFPSKEKLFEAVVLEMIDEFNVFEPTLYKGLEEYSLKEGLAVFIDRIINLHYNSPELMRTVMQNTAHVETLDDLPGFELFIEFITHFLKTFQKNIPINVPVEEVGKLVYSFSALVINYLGASSSYATVLKMEPNSTEYQKWVKDTLMLLFLPLFQKFIFPNDDAR